MKSLTILMVLVLGSSNLPTAVDAHCDTLDGPVVEAARKALEKGEITPVLKWIKKDHESEAKAAFQKTMAVRGKGAEAKELADRYFFETLVRLHRAGEGAPYNGLLPGPAEPIVRATDEALEKGSAEDVLKHVTEAVASGIRKRFAETAAKKKHADESVAAGREFVEAYVEFTHYVERVHVDAVGAQPHGKAPEGAAHKH